MSERTDHSDALLPEDLEILDAFRRGSGWLRAVSCTLARRGVAFRLAFPGRARGLLEALESYPLYKAGQFLFDLLEWEDFMVDGPPPPIVATTLDPRALQRLSGALREVRAHLDGEEAAGAAGPPAEARTGPRPGEGGAGADEALPPLEAGFHLYADVVLGILDSISRASAGTTVDL